MRSINELSDVRVEASVVGTLLRNPKFYYHFEALKPEHFSEKTNAIVFEVVKMILNDNSEDVSDFSVYLRIVSEPAFERQFNHENIDITEYIENLKRLGTDDTEEYISRCKTIIDYAFRRDAVEELNNLSGYVATKNSSANELNMYIHDRIGKFSEEYIVGNSVKPFGEVIEDLWEEVMERQNPENGMAGIPSVIPRFNEYFTYEKGELILVGARPRLWVAV